MALQWKEILRSDGDLKGKVDGEDVGDIKSGSQAGTTAKGVTDAAFDGSNVLKEANAHANLKNSGISISAAGVLSGANVGGGTVTGAGLDVIMRDGTGAPAILKNDEITLTSANGTVTLNNAGSGSIGKPDLGLGNVLDQAQTSTFRQDAVPTALAAGDLWIDTDDNNKSYVATAAGDDAVEAGKWEEITISKATVGLASVEDKALSTCGWGDIGIATTDVTSTDVGLPNVLNQAQTSTFRQDACPTALAAGDIWIDTNDNNKSYRATTAGDDAVASGEWEEITISKATVGLASVEDKALSTCGWGDIGIATTDVTSTDVGLPNVLNQAQTSTFRQDACPTALAAGDIWIDTDDENKSYRATTAGDDAVASGEWEAISISKTGVGLGNVVDQAVTVSGGKLKFGATAQTLDADKIGGSTLAETKAAAVSTATTNIIGDAPDALNTLNELAAALGDDASYASTMTTALGNRQSKHVEMTSATAPAATSYSAGRTGTFSGTLYMVVDE